MQKVSKNVYVETGFRGCNVGFVVTNDGVVMIDTPHAPEDAAAWREEVSGFGPVRYLINTEPHGDHFTGNCFFSGIIVAHEGTRDAILDISSAPRELVRLPPGCSLPEDFSFRAPDITFTRKVTLYLGDHTFQLINHPGHTPYQVTVYIPEERVAFTSDNIFCRVQPFLRQALPYEWLDSLKALQKLDVDVLVPGHGDVCDKGYIPEMSAIISDWINAVDSAIKNGMSLEKAQDMISFLDRYPMEAGAESMAQEVQRMNVSRLYEVLLDSER